MISPCLLVIFFVCLLLLILIIVLYFILFPNIIIFQHQIPSHDYHIRRIPHVGAEPKHLSQPGFCLLHLAAQGGERCEQARPGAPVRGSMCSAS